MYEGLNKEQYEAVKHVNGPCLVMAGAGSGKTRVLTTRIINLIEEGIPDYNILAITFTNKAAGEMKERINNMYGYNSCFIGTFHAFGMRILKKEYSYANLGPNFTILDSDDTLSIVKKILKNNNIDPKKYNPKAILNKISSIKNEQLTDIELERTFLTPFDKMVKEIYFKYRKILEESNVVDFDDLLLKPVEIFKNNPEILEYYQNKYRYILVDEYQDTNPVQYKMIKLLSEKYRNIFVVGDMNQSIYGFRQADYTNILNFEKDYKDAHVVKLEENYRSTNNILNAANSVIKHNKTSKDMKLWSKNGDGEKIKYIKCNDERHEVSIVLEQINNLTNSGYNLNDIAILYRTNGQSRVFEEGFIAKNIPYKVIGSYFFYNRKEIKDLISYLKLIYNNDDDISLRRIINVPKRGIGDTSIDNLELKARNENISMFDALSSGKEMIFKNIIEVLTEKSKEESLLELFDDVIELTGLKAELESDKTLESELRLDNLLEFKSIIDDYLHDNEDGNLGEFLDNISLISDASLHKEADDEVTMMTIHSAKGLEFKVVFLVGVEEGIFPHFNSFTEEDGIEEERRLCYVGITRAKELLYITTANKRLLYGKTESNRPSRFIDEINKEYLDITIYNGFEEVIDKNKYYNNESSDFKPGDKVNHEQFGDGIVVGMDDMTVKIAFKIGIKTLMKNHKSLRKV